MGLTGVSNLFCWVFKSSAVDGINRSISYNFVGEIGIQAYQDVDTGSNTSYTSVATGSNTSYSDVA